MSTPNPLEQRLHMYVHQETDACAKRFVSLIAAVVRVVDSAWFALERRRSAFQLVADIDQIEIITALYVDFWLRQVDGPQWQQHVAGWRYRVDDPSGTCGRCTGCLDLCAIFAYVRHRGYRDALGEALEKVNAWSPRFRVRVVAALQQMVAQSDPGAR